LPLTVSLRFACGPKAGPKGGPSETKGEQKASKKAAEKKKMKSLISGPNFSLNLNLIHPFTHLPNTLPSSSF